MNQSLRKRFVGFLVAAILPLTGFSQTENALSFDNIDDNVVVPGASALIAGSNQVTLTCWVKPENTNIVFPDYDGFAGIRNNVDADFYMVHFGPHAVEARLRNSSGINYDIVDTALHIGVWQHYSLVYSGSELTLYRNDTIVKTIIASGTFTNPTEPMHIGGMPYSSFNYYLNGQLDEVTLWNRALTRGEIRCLARFGTPPTSSGLQLYYKFNQGTPGGINVSQTSLTDETGHINGTFNNFSLSGTTSNFVQGIRTVNDISAQICQGATYTFGTQQLTTPGIYVRHLPTTAGCDSTIRLNLSYSHLNDSVSVSGSTLTAIGTGYTYQWVDCQSSYQPVIGETQSSFSPVSNGDYALIVSNGSCSDTSQCVTVTTAGIAVPSTIEGLRAYPNPVGDQLTLEWTDAASSVLITVLDGTGRVVARQQVAAANHTVISSSSWSVGSYTVRLQSSSGASAVLKVTK